MKQLSLFFLLVISFSVSLPVFSQELEPFESVFVIDGTEFQNPYFGGFDNAQFSNIDFDRDGVLDLFVFDRQAHVVIPFLRDTEQNKWVYAPEYRSIFPDDLKHWVFILDYNGDGISDIFTSKYVAGSGVRVYTGSYDSEWNFDLVKFSTGSGSSPKDFVYYQNLSGQYRNLDIATADLPAFVDIDFDGDIDIIAFQESGNNIYYFRNTSEERGFGSDSLLFQLDKECWGGVSESFLGSDLFLADVPGECGEGLWNDEEDKKAAPLHATSTIAAFDIGRDNDIDVFIGDADLAAISYLENTPSNDFDWFTYQTRSFPENSEAISLAAFAIPFFVDIDDDGRKDMIVASNQLLNSKNIVPIQSYTQMENGDFTRIEDDWIKEIGVDVGSNSAPVLEDVNQDGLIDLVIGNFTNFSNGESKASLFYFENIGTTNEAKFQLMDTDWLGLSDLDQAYFNLKPCFGDLDNDGDNDLIVGTNNGTIIYLNNIAGEGVSYAFSEPIEEYSDIQVSLNAAPQIIDLNHDNLADLVIGSELGILNFYGNVGSSSSPRFESENTHSANIVRLGGVKVTDTPQQFSGRATPHFVNTEDELICLIGNISGKVRAFRNITIDGSDWELFSTELDDVYEGTNVTISAGNIDSSGFLEYIIGNERGGVTILKSSLISGNEELFSDKLQARFTLYPNPFTDILKVNYNEYSFGANNDVVIKLYNIIGQCLITQEFSGSSINGSDLLEDGVYFWSIRSNEGLLQSGTIVKK